MAIDLAEKAFVINTYILVVTTYVFYVAAFIIFWNAFSTQIPVFCFWFFVMIINHLTMSQNLDIPFDKVKYLFGCQPEKVRRIMMLLLCPMIYGEFGNKVKKVGALMAKTAKFLLYPIIVLKAILCISLIWLTLHMKSPVELFIGTMFILTQSVLMYHNYKPFQVVWYLVVMSVPILIFFTIAIGIIVTVTIKRKIYRTQVTVEETGDPEVLRRPRSRRSDNTRRMVAYALPNPRIEPVEILPVAVTKTKKSHIRRYDTIGAIARILKEWRRGPSFKKESHDNIGIIGLMTFEAQEIVVQLKGGEGHIFHKEGLKGWAMRRKKTGPLGRTDIVDLYNQNLIRSFQHPSLEWSRIYLS